MVGRVEPIGPDFSRQVNEGLTYPGVSDVGTGNCRDPPSFDPVIESAVLVVWNRLIQIKWVDRKKWWSSRAHLLLEPTHIVIGNSSKSRDAA